MCALARWTPRATATLRQLHGNRLWRTRVPSSIRGRFSGDPAFQWLPRAASVVLFVALCALVTHWVLTFSAMRTIPVPKSARIARTDAVETGAIATLFGGSAQPGVRDIQLIGVVADLDGPGRSAAIISLDGGPPKAVRAGASLSSEIRLTEIHGRNIVIERNGVRQEIALPLQDTASAGRPGNVPASPPSGAAAPLATPMPAPIQSSPPQSANASARQPSQPPQQNVQPQPPPQAEPQPSPQEIPQIPGQPFRAVQPPGG